MSGSFSDFLALPIEQAKQHFKSLQSADLSMALAGLPEATRKAWLEAAYHDSPNIAKITMEEAAWNSANATLQEIQEAQTRIAHTVFVDRWKEAL